MTHSYGSALRQRLHKGILPLVGVSDVFSALLAAQHFEGLFCSGFSFSASQYGLPDAGFVGWRDMLDFATRVRQRLPQVHLLVDVDDGFGDEVICSEKVVGDRNPPLQFELWGQIGARICRQASIGQGFSAKLSAGRPDGGCFLRVGQEQSTPCAL